MEKLDEGYEIPTGLDEENAEDESDEDSSRVKSKKVSKASADVSEKPETNASNGEDSSEGKSKKMSEASTGVSEKLEINNASKSAVDTGGWSDDEIEGLDEEDEEINASTKLDLKVISQKRTDESSPIESPVELKSEDVQSKDVLGTEYYQKALESKQRELDDLQNEIETIKEREVEILENRKVEL